MTVTEAATGVQEAPNKRLFFACFFALVTTSFGVILRALTLPQWEAEFNLTKTQAGEIAGVGLWPFCIFYTEICPDLMRFHMACCFKDTVKNAPKLHAVFLA